jgi:hypothetical protein
MEKTRTDLVRIKTYADQNRKSTTWVYNQAKEKKITIVVIDNVKFVKIS